MRLPGPTGESNELSLHGRGVFACISPWNFPLAIFLGQIAAALAAGNAVVAKPASQTPLIAAQLVELARTTGLPDGVLQYLPGDGALGAALVSHPEIAGVVFTGSTQDRTFDQSCAGGARRRHRPADRGDRRSERVVRRFDRAARTTDRRCHALGLRQRRAALFVAAPVAAAGRHRGPRARDDPRCDARAFDRRSGGPRDRHRSADRWRRGRGTRRRTSRRCAPRAVASTRSRYPIIAPTDRLWRRTSSKSTTSTRCTKNTSDRCCTSRASTPMRSTR